MDLKHWDSQFLFLPHDRSTQLPESLFLIIKHDDGIHGLTTIPYESDPSEWWKQIQLQSQIPLNGGNRFSSQNSFNNI
jgi:hypothetical protein